MQIMIYLFDNLFASFFFFGHAAELDSPLHSTPLSAFLSLSPAHCPSSRRMNLKLLDMNMDD